MNSTSRVLTSAVFFLATLGGVSAETVIDQLYGARKYELADAYWAAGQRFAELGQADRAAEFQAKAKALFPGYVPGQAPVIQNPQVAAATPQLPAMEVVKQKNLQGQKIARLQFQKLLRGYLTGSSATVAAVLGSSVQVQGQPANLDAAAVSTFLDAHPASAGAPDELFVTDSLDITDGPGQSVVISVKANPNAPGDLAGAFPFWKPTQTYTFDRVDDTWKLVKIQGSE